MKKTRFAVECVRFDNIETVDNSNKEFVNDYLEGKESLGIKQGYDMTFYDTKEEAINACMGDVFSLARADLLDGTGYTACEVVEEYDEDGDLIDSDVVDYFAESNYYTTLKKKYLLNSNIDADEWMAAHNVPTSEIDWADRYGWDYENLIKYATAEEIARDFDYEFVE